MTAKKRSGPVRQPAGALPAGGSHRPQPQPAPDHVRPGGPGRAGGLHRGARHPPASVGAPGPGALSTDLRGAAAPGGPDGGGWPQCPASWWRPTTRSPPCWPWWRTCSARDLDFMEEAVALRRLIVQHGLSQEEAARKVGKSQSAVANKLRLLKLAPGGAGGGQGGGALRAPRPQPAAAAGGAAAGGRPVHGPKSADGGQGGGLCGQAGLPAPTRPSLSR